MILNNAYNIYFELSVLPIELILLIYVFGNYKDDRDTKATNYRFKIYALLTTVGTLLDVVTAITFMWGDTLSPSFHTIFLSLNFLMGLCSSMGFYFYMVAFAGMQNSERILNIISYSINIIYVIILVINYFTGIAFSYVPGVGLVRNLLYGPVGYLFPLYYIFLGVSLSFFRRKRFTKVQRSFLTFGFIIVLGIFILQIKLEEQALMAYFVSAICLFMLFLTLETPEYTELVNTLEELDKVRSDEKRALDRIKRSDEAKSTFLSHLSHEIKTPINAIMGYTEEIIKANVTDDVRENAASAFKGARRLDQFFTDIVDNMADINEFGSSAMVSIDDIEKELYLNFGFDLDEKKNAKDFISRSGLLSLSSDPDSYPDSSMYRILCVDDNELNMELLVRTVKQFGFSVDGAVDGKAAIELVTKNDYDLILMDHMMPVMDGVEAMHYLRDNSMCDLTPIIVVTANAVRGEREKYLSEGFDSFLPKPFTGGSLLRVVGKFLPIATMETVIKVNSTSGISGFMLTSTFSRPLIAPGAKILIAGRDRDNINRLSRLFLTTMARIDVVYGCDECIERLSGGDYDIVFVEDGLRSGDNRSIKTYIWNSVDIPTILITGKNTVMDPAVIYDSYTDYISINDDADVIDAILLLYLPKDKVSVIGTGEEKKKFTLNISSSYNLSDGVEVVKPKNASVPDKEKDIEISGELVFLKDVKGIDIEQGVYNCGSEEGLKRAIEIFISTTDTKADEIDSLYTAGDIDGYTIRVHALKSSARIIGALELSELARALEAAGKDHNIEFIGEKTADLLAEYRTISKLLSEKLTVDEPETKTPATPEIIKDAYTTIYELALMMDYDSIEMIFEALRGYEFAPGDAETLEKIRRSMEALDWESVLKIAKEAL